MCAAARKALCTPSTQPARQHHAARASTTTHRQRHELTTKHSIDASRCCRCRSAPACVHSATCTRTRRRPAPLSASTQRRELNAAGAPSAAFRGAVRRLHRSRRSHALRRLHAAFAGASRGSAPAVRVTERKARKPGSGCLGWTCARASFEMRPSCSRLEGAATAAAPRICTPRCETSHLQLVTRRTHAALLIGNRFRG